MCNLMVDRKCPEDMKEEALERFRRRYPTSTTYRQYGGGRPPSDEPIPQATTDPLASKQGQFR